MRTLHGALATDEDVLEEVEDRELELVVADVDVVVGTGLVVEDVDDDA